MIQKVPHDDITDRLLSGTIQGDSMIRVNFKKQLNQEIKIEIHLFYFISKNFLQNLIIFWNRWDIQVSTSAES